MGRVAVAIPWRDRGDRLRQAHLNAVRAWFEVNLPDANVTTVDSDGDVFSLAGARNTGVRLAEAGGFDVVVLCDADNYPDAQPLLDAIDGCQETRLVHLPYVTYRNGSFMWQGSMGGIYVTTPTAWWRVGGQDERFRGWGPEDYAFSIAHATLAGEPMPRHHGVLTHLPHPSPPEKADPTHPLAVAATALYQQYVAASGDVDAMAALVDG